MMARRYQLQEARKGTGGEPATSMPSPQQPMVNQPDCGEATNVGNGKMAGKVALGTGGDSGIGQRGTPRRARRKG